MISQQGGIRLPRSGSRPMRSALDRLGPFVALVVLSGAVALASPSFLTLENLFAVGVQRAVVAILAVGETLVIIGGPH